MKKPAAVSHRESVAGFCFVLFAQDEDPLTGR